MLNRRTTIARVAAILGFGILLSACTQNWSAEELQDLSEKRKIERMTRDSAGES